MSSYELLMECLPAHLLVYLRQGAGGAAWPISAIPAVIEASRAAGLISVGGDLQVHLDESVWESPNIGVVIFSRELSGLDRLADEAAALALKKFMALGREADLLKEAAAGCPGVSEAIARGTPPQLYFSWSVRSA